MGEMILGDLEEDLLRRLRERAATSGQTPEEEATSILRNALRDDVARFRARARAMRERYRDRSHTDSVALLRQDRDR